MKFHLPLTMVLCVWILAGYGQDSAYYHTAFNSSGDSLKSKLYNIIKGHTEYPYTSSSTDVWDILKETDRDTLDSTHVILIYSNRSVDAAQEYNNGSGWNREHVWAKSRGNFGTSQGPGTDVHHLRPCDISVNSSRSNRNFDDCTTCIDIIDNGFNTGSKRDANNFTFSPPSNVKGDIARMIFYMAVRYEGDNGEPDLELSNTLLSQTDKSPLHSVVNTLLNWNQQDPVDNWERNRNQVIYSYQGNKNPFIDYPELAEYIWGDSLGVIWKPVSSIGIEENDEIEIIITPNPSNGVLKIKGGPIDSFTIYNMSGCEVLSQQTSEFNPQIDISNHKDGVYILRGFSNQKSFYKKVVLNHEIGQ